jgi:hypothetical protein
MPKSVIRISALLLVATLSAASLALARAGQQSAAKPPNKLVTAKLICVTPMPNALDQWILEDLRGWGRYKLTGDPEGADLVLRAYKPEKPPQYVLKKGDVPQPKKERHHAAITITVVDWVANEAVWQADILDRKPKKEESGTPVNGPDVEIDAHGLKPDELAQKITRKLRDYVEELEKSQGASR